MAVREIIQLGEKGGDLILKKFQQINKQKEKFIKPAIAKLASMYDKGQEPEKKPETESEKASAIIKSNANAAANGLNNLAKSASSFDPTRFSTGILDTVRGVANKAIIGAGGGAGGAWGRGLAEAATSITDSMAELINTGASMATNALSEIKASQISAIDTMTKESRMKFYGGDTLRNNDRLTTSEKSGVIENVASKFGKITPALSSLIDKLLSGNNDIQQASEIAAGNFQALGTDQGYFMQQISDSLGSLPPTMKQAIMTQLIPIAQPGINQQPQNLSDIQKSRAGLVTQDQENDKRKGFKNNS